MKENKLNDVDQGLLNAGIDSFQRLGMRIGYRAVLAVIEAGATLEQVKKLCETEVI